MDTEAHTSELGRQMLARRLLADHAAAKGYPGHASWAHWALHSQWLEIPRASRPASFHEYVIRELGK